MRFFITNGTEFDALETIALEAFESIIVTDDDIGKWKLYKNPDDTYLSINASSLDNINTHFREITTEMMLVLL